MFGLLLVSHGAIGEEMLGALDHIVGKQEQAAAINIAPDDDMDECRNLILSKISEVNTGDGVVLLADMFGGTPNNLAISVMPKTDAVVLAGFNLPVLVKLASLRASDKSLQEAVEEAADAGRKYIQVVTENLAAPAS